MCIVYGPAKFDSSRYKSCFNVQFEWRKQTLKFTMGKGRHLSRADIHLPSGLVGVTLLPGAERDSFKSIRNDINVYIDNMTNLFQLMKLMDSVEDTKRLGHRKSMIVLSHVMTYLRIKLLSKELRVIELAAVVTDALVKNGQFRIHILVGNRLFMKTISIIIGQLLSDERTDCCRVGSKVLHILLGWGESFSTGEKRLIYPHIVSTYEKMRLKYGLKYQRQDCDLLRVPISFDAINQYKILKPTQNCQALSSEDFVDSPWDSDSISSNSNTLHENSISFYNKRESPVNKIGRLQRMYAARTIENKRSQHQLNFELESPVRWINTKKGWQIITSPCQELKMYQSLSEALSPMDLKCSFGTNNYDLCDTDDIVKSPVHRRKKGLSCSKEDICLTQQADTPDVISRSAIFDASSPALIRCTSPVFTNIDAKERGFIDRLQTLLNFNDTDQDKLILKNESTSFFTCQADSVVKFGEVVPLEIGLNSNFQLSCDSSAVSSARLVDVAPSLSLISDAVVDQESNLTVSIMTDLLKARTNSADIRECVMCDKNRAPIESIDDILAPHNESALYFTCQAGLKLNFEEIAPVETGSATNHTVLNESTADALASDNQVTNKSLGRTLEVDCSSDEKIYTPKRNKKCGAPGAEAEYIFGSNSKHSLIGSHQIVRYSTISMSPSNERIGRVRYLSPSSDSTLLVKYFGHQRVLVKADRTWC